MLSSCGDEEAKQGAETAESPQCPCTDATSADIFTVTIGATVPTGFEPTAAEEVKEKIGVDARISKDRGRIYFPVSTDKLFQEEALSEFQQLASKLPWTNALEVWKLNGALKKKKGHRKGGSGAKVKPNSETSDATTASAEQQELPEAVSVAEGQITSDGSPDVESGTQEEATPKAKLIKFRVTCNRAGDKHSFSSNEAARDFGGAVQDFFQWKADMTKFDIEVLLNIHNEEVVIGIALTEESLHRRNISHFGPTTLRSTLCYGMLRLCNPQPSDVIVDPMCGTGAIPLEGAIEFNSAFYIAGDNNDMAVKRTVNNVCHIQKRRAEKGSVSALPIDTVQWDLCSLPIRTSSVDIIITDMPFGKRIGSRKKNWDLYPSCLREMARVCRPGSGKAVLLTQDKKCFAKAVSRMGGLWRKLFTVWVNVGGLHAGVYLLQRTGAVFGQTPEDVYESRGTVNTQVDEKQEKERS
ncbi:THUMP domain-containing protein 3 [Solea senegalensis]|uniref:THUMP domain-containing protein 3 n=1 Tax=Solea senegalensis TaxID=28829 RepID=A0AAV6QRW2_SOLSE|nr:THUMP domain-containing protein 3 [Solea senegalensis]